MTGHRIALKNRVQLGMLEITKNADVVNKFLNDPSIYPWVCGTLTEYLDVTKLIENPDNLFFVGQYGGMAFIKTGMVYDLHSFCLPEGRGKIAVREGLETIQYVFDVFKPEYLTTMCPINNKAAIGMSRLCGFKKYRTVKDAFPYLGKVYDADLYVRYK